MTPKFIKNKTIYITNKSDHEYIQELVKKWSPVANSVYVDLNLIADDEESEK